MEADHEPQVEDNVHDTGETQEQERPPGIAHRPKDPASHVVNKKTRDPAEIDLKIFRRQGKNIVRRVHQFQHERSDIDPNPRKDHAADKGDGNGGFHRQMELFVVVGAEIAANDDAGSDGNAVEKQNQHIDDAGGGADGGQRFAADKVAHHKTVHRIVELLKQVAEEQRDRKHDQMPDDGAGRHIHGLQLLMFV